MPANYRKAVVQLGQWMFYLGRFGLMRDVLTKGDCYVDFDATRGQRALKVVSQEQEWPLHIDDNGQFLRIDGTPLINKGRPVCLTGNEVDARTRGSNSAINFFHHAFGLLDGALLNSRETIEDPAAFYSDFLRAIASGRAFGQKLAAVIGPNGAVTFEDTGHKVPCVADLVNSEPGSRIFMVPERVGQKIVMFTFDVNGQWIGEFVFDPDEKLFYYEREDARVYLAVLEKNDHGGGDFQEPSVLQITLFKYIFRFFGRDRTEGELFKITTVCGRYWDLHPYFGRRRQDHQLIQRTGKEGDRSIISVGEVPVTKRSQAGKIPTVAISREPTGVRRYYFSYGRPYYLSEKTILRYGLHEGSVLRVEPLFGQVCALCGKGGQRIEFIMDWLWNGQQFVLDHTSPADIISDRMSGVRALEQTAITYGGANGLLTAGGKHIPVVGYLPWSKAEPTPLSILVEGGERVLFFRDAARFTPNDWEIINLIMKAREGRLGDRPQRLDEAQSMAQSAASNRADAEKNILEIELLERAYGQYIEAFSLAPAKDSEYLRSALELRELITLRKQYLARRVEFYRKLNALFAPTGAAAYAERLTEYFGRKGQSPLTVAYIIEIILGIAEGRYNGDRQLFQRVFESLPQVLDIDRRVGKRLMMALRLLAADAMLFYVPKWVVYHPTEGKIDLFGRRAKKLGITSGFRLDWAAPILRKTISIVTVQPANGQTVKRLRRKKPSVEITLSTLRRKALRLSETYALNNRRYEGDLLPIEEFTRIALALLLKVESLIAQYEALKGTVDLNGQLDSLLALRDTLKDFKTED